MRRKRLMAAAVSAVLAASVAACGGGSKSTPAGTTAAAAAAAAPAATAAAAETTAAETAAAEAQKDEAAAADQAAETTAAETTEAAEKKDGGFTGGKPSPGSHSIDLTAWEGKTAEPISVETGHWTWDWHDPEIHEYMSAGVATVSTVYLTGDSENDYRYLADALEKRNEQDKENCRKEVKEAVADNADQIRESAHDYDIMAMTADETIRICRADSEIFSFLEIDTGYSGGAHEYAGYGGYNYLTESGERLTLADVVDASKLASVEELLAKKLRENYPEIRDTELENVESMLSDYKPEQFSFVVKQDGVDFWFSPYEIASWAAGPLTAEIRFDELPEVFTGVGTHAAADYAVQPADDMNFRFVSADGKEHAVQISTDENQHEFNSYENITVDLDGKKTTENFFGYSLNTRYVRNGGKDYLWIFAQSEDDYTRLYVYDMNGGTPVITGYEDGIYPGYRMTEDASNYEEYDNTKPHEEIYEDSGREQVFSDPASVKLAKSQNLLSTYGAMKTYRVGGAGMPVSDDPAFVPTYSFTLKVLKDFKAVSADKNTLKTGDAITVKAGDEFTIYRTDGTSKVWFLLKDGNCGMVEVKGSTVDGTDINELFDGMLFAG